MYVVIDEGIEVEESMNVVFMYVCVDVFCRSRWFRWWLCVAS